MDARGVVYLSLESGAAGKDSFNVTFSSMAKTYNPVWWICLFVVFFIILIFVY